jgi:hypothetical protein
MVQINYPYVCVGAGQNGERNAAATVSAAGNAFTIAWRRKKKKIVAAAVTLLADLRRHVASKVTAVARTLSSSCAGLTRVSMRQGRVLGPSAWTSGS